MHWVRSETIGYAICSSSLWFQVSAPPLAKRTANQIENETLKKRISNVE
ncbi:hypothetical protein D1AOALGA4SA_8141 [Olavius algarvensis Delta 1 endosymbiont]|nr:hypothetical protein D1AOALGA4SA_8141 [Olavius algarvensis Delta 1 endosymbiont]